ncbi:MAG: HEAT repeat domain-containing protein [Armatimonadota bacterium]|nr:HEAT repeat domain-containing protein [bacterium]
MMRYACYTVVLALCLTAVLISLPCTVQAQTSELEYTSEEIQNTSAEVFLERMAKPEPGYDKFAAMHALGRKAKVSDPETCRNVLNLVISTMYDQSRSINQRFQCCYAISESGDARGVPYLVEVLFKDPSNTMRSVAAEALAGFKNSAEAHNALVQASQQETDAKVLEVINRRLAEGEAQYTPEQIKETSAEVFLVRIGKPEPGYDKFAAMHALGRKAKESDLQTRQDILSMVVSAMNDKSRSIDMRFQCCYVISDCGDEQWVPSLVDVLLNDPSDVMRSVAAEALGYFKNCAAAQDALLVAAQDEKSQKVLDVINRQGTAEYTTAQIDAISAEAFLKRLQQPEQGYHKFAALHALAKKAKASDADSRKVILTTVIAAMNDKSRTELQRFQCCYVISDCGDEQWVGSLVDVLMKDPSTTMRAVAAEALGKFVGNATAHNALLNASKQETSQKVLDVINRVLPKFGSAS